MSYLAPDTWRSRQDVDRFTDASSLARDDLGGAVIPNGVSTYGWCADTFENPCITGLASYADIHLPGLAQGVLGWSDERASVRFQLPAGTRAVRRFDALQFRTSINPDYDVNQAFQFQDLSVVLVDGSGHRASVAASDVGNNALAYPSGLRRYYGHVILQQLRFPLSSFTGVDLGDVRSVQGSGSTGRWPVRSTWRTSTSARGRPRRGRLRTPHPSRPAAGVPTSRPKHGERRRGAGDDAAARRGDARGRRQSCAPTSAIPRRARRRARVRSGCSS